MINVNFVKNVFFRDFLKLLFNLPHCVCNCPFEWSKDQVVMNFEYVLHLQVLIVSVT